MNGSSQQNTLQQCIYCGKPIRVHLQQCPHCREAQSERRPERTTRSAPTADLVRNGLLLILLSVVAHYLGSGDLPLAIPAMPDAARPVLTLLVPLLFLAGLIATLHGVFLRLRA